MDSATESTTRGKEGQYLDHIEHRRRTARALTTALAILWCVCSAWVDVAPAQERLREWEFALTSGRLGTPGGLWSDGTTMWAADGMRLLAYNLATKEEVVGKLFDIKHHPRGPGMRALDIWSDGTTMWMLHHSSLGIRNPVEVLAYDVATRARARDRDIYTGLPDARGRPRCMWSDGTTMWLACGSLSNRNKVWAYDMVTRMRTPDREFELDMPSGTQPRSLWSDGTTMWIASENKLYAHDMVTRARAQARAPDKDFDVAATPIGIWSDGTTMWVLTCGIFSGDGCAPLNLYAYDMVAKVRVPDKEIHHLHDPIKIDQAGIWSDGATMWVADDYYDALFAYDMATKVRKPDKDIETLQTAGNNNPLAIWSDGTTMWVLDYGGRVYAYDMATKVRKPTEEFAAEFAGLWPLPGIWSDGTTMWVMGCVVGEDDYCDLKLQAHDLATKARRPDEDAVIPAATGNRNSSGIWSDGRTMWIADWEDHRIYAYDMATWARAPDRDFNVPQLEWNLNERWERPRGIWSDGTTMWVAGVWEKDDEGRIEPGDVFAYDMATRVRVRDKDLYTIARDGAELPRGVWSDGSTMWVSDYRTGRLYAYDPATGARAPDKNFNTLSAAGNSAPEGIWSDGVTIWVADSVDAKLYAYDVATRARTPDKDFDTLRAAGNSAPEGIWSDGSTMWVVDWRDVKLYAYAMATRVRTPDRDVDLHRIAGFYEDIWSDGATFWVGGSEYDEPALYAYDVATGRHMPEKRFNFPPNEDPPRPDAIWSDGLRMWVTSSTGDVRVYAWPFTTTCPQCPRYPDLIVRLHDTPVNDYTPLVGQSFTLQVVVRNQGSRTADETRIRAYRSSDTVISMSDAEVGFNRVASLAPDGAGIQAFVLSAPSIPGTYYYGACVDSVSGERTMTNNCSAGVSVTVSTSFTDDPLEAGVTAVKAVHFTELREHIDALRVSHGLFPFLWTDATLRGSTTGVAAVHVSELREALRQAYDAAGQSVGFSTAPAQAGGFIRAAHVNELRRAVEALERRP